MHPAFFLGGRGVYAREGELAGDDASRHDRSTCGHRFEGMNQSDLGRVGHTTRTLVISCIQITDSS